MGPWEIALLLVIILVVFGVGKLPKVGDTLGKSIREFRKASSKDGEVDQSNETKSGS